MRSVRVYFVRHGESEANRKRVEQGAHGLLSLRGRLQAEFAGKRFKHIPVDALVSSPFERARQTAEIINQNLHKNIIFSNLFIERMPPSILIGKELDDPQVLESYSTKKDKEHFEKFKERAETAIDYLLSLKQEKILVVTHGGFLRMIVSAMIFGEELTFNEYVKILYSLKIKNTGITICEYFEPSKKKNIPIKHTGWKIIALNDHAHLGEKLKKLRFRSHYIPKILSVATTTTWRMFDEKKLSKGDELILVNSDTEEEFGRAIIISVRKKSLRHVKVGDLPTHEQPRTIKHVLDVFRDYYGDYIPADTEVKIITFEVHK